MGKRYCIIRHICVSNVAPINPVRSLFCHTVGCSLFLSGITESNLKKRCNFADDEKISFTIGIAVGVVGRFGTRAGRTHQPRRLYIVRYRQRQQPET